ncbi:MAG: UvrB/UvrC motif-containing protein [Gemmatimonadaceae bacterium]|nr:UvrB/UvrC motif-containing protein [Gemmatimonadaceae bacterium]
MHLTKVVQGEVKQEHLCAKCAAERGIETTVANPPKTMLGEFLHAVQEQAADAPETVRCTFCAMTLKDFRATGRLGCSHCYQTFEPSLRELLRRVHGSSQHVGRKYVPPAPELMERATTIGELRDRLRRAIASEDFEIAASLRDKIKAFE